MESEKVKEIKRKLKNCGLPAFWDTASEALTLINELESEKDNLYNLNQNLISDKQVLIDENERLLKLQARGGCSVAELEKENESLKKQLIAIDTLDETNFEKRHSAIVFITEKQLKQFAERLKEDFTKKKNKLIKEREIAVKYDDFILIDALAYKIDELQYAIDKIEETLKEFIDD